MSYRVRIDALAQRDIDQFSTYLADYSETFALEQIERIDSVFRDALSQSPATWSYFFVTGAPYRACLFRVGRRTHFWIVYTIDEETKTVNVLRFWNASKDPATFRI
jgi:plasmid stabilization system protein ParE